ncbi:MAG: hypothetical protein ACFFAI_03670 [Promethearchaeota archaeon]
MKRNKIIVNHYFLMHKFLINKHLELRLENNKTKIYVNNELFIQCKYLLLNVSIEDLDSLNDIYSIDNEVLKLNKSIELSRQKEILISPEVEFWGHCSNLQVWYENNYNSYLLHSNLAFPLLRKLTEVGDLLAKKVFKEEIAKRFENGTINTIRFLAYNNYLFFLNKLELECLFEQSSPNLIQIIIEQLENLMNSTIINYSKRKELIDLILFLDLKFDRTLLIEILDNFPHKYKDQFAKSVLLHLNYKEFNDYKIPYGRFCYYFEQFVAYLYDNYPGFNEQLKFLVSGFYNSSYSFDDRLAYGSVSYK